MLGESVWVLVMGKVLVSPAVGWWSFKTWSVAFEAGLAITVLLGMLSLWLCLDASQTSESTLTAWPFLNPSPQPLPELCDRTLYPSRYSLRSDQLTILVNGFIEARLPLLQSTLKTYSSSSAVHSILLLWSNTSTPDSLLQSTSFESLGSPIYILRQSSTSLNDRFLPRKLIQTKAVMICDDDITVEVKNLEFALEVWRENMERIVGFFPRAHSFAMAEKSWIYTKHPGRYSILLTKSMVLATEYLWRYTCEMPVGVKAYVDKGMNCEDIAMNFLVANFSGLGPVLVEGQPRDWGDTRNSAEELTSMGLSARADHRKDRGDCIREFHRLWNGMHLRFSHGKAIPNVNEQANCLKFGHLIDCDASASTLRDARRHAGHHLVKKTFQYAYVTILHSKAMFYSALVWAQAIRNSGSVHDLVLLLDVNSGLTKDNETLTQHFDVVKEVGKQHDKTMRGRSVGMLSAWQLEEYECVVFIELNLLCLSNLDFMFGLPEPAAAPSTLRPQEFHMGLLVLKPSNKTFTELLKCMESMSGGVNKHEVLNGFFSDWFRMEAAHRLPLRFNMPLHLSFLVGAHGNENEARGNGSHGNSLLPAVLQYPQRELISIQTVWMNSEATNHSLEFQHKSSSFGVWLEILAALRSKSYQPLDDEQISRLNPKPNTRVETLSSWPPPKLPSLTKTPNPKPRLRRAFTTVLDSVENLAAVGGWITTFSRFHLSTPGHETLLLVHDALDSDLWKPFQPLFNSIVVVGGSIVSLLHVWNQTEYEKLVYIDPRFIFLSNCEFLLAMESFAAAPDFVFPDRFSLQVMVIQPDHERFLELSKRLDSISTVQFLNECYSLWYSSSGRHRIEAVFNAERSGLVDLADWKLFRFYDGSPFLNPGSESGSIWQKHVCNGGTRTVELLGRDLELCNFKPL